MFFRQIWQLIPVLLLFVSCMEQEVISEIAELTQARKHGIDYVYDPLSVPQVHITISEEEWNSLLMAFDADKNTKQYIRCTVSYAKGDDVTEISNAGITPLSLWMHISGIWGLTTTTGGNSFMN